MTRKMALEYIRVEAAKYGTITKEAMRYYVESRMSYKSFQDAISTGLKQYKYKNKEA